MNWFKKKIVPLTMIGSLLIGITGQVAFASTYTDTLATITSVNTQISSDGHSSDVTAAVNLVSGLVNANPSVIQPILSKIDTKIGNQSNYAAVTDANVKALFMDTIKIVFGDPTGLSDIKNNATTISTANELALLGSTISSGTLTLTADDFVNFFNHIGTLMVNNISIADLDPANLKTLFITEMKAALNDQTYKISEIMTNIGITQSDISNLYHAIETPLKSADPNDVAIKAVVKAYLSTQIIASTTVSNNGRTVKPVLTVKGVNLIVPNSLLTWTSVSLSTGVTMASDGTLTLASSSTSGTATIKASYSGTDFYTDSNIALTYTAPSSGSGGTTTATPTPTPTPVPIPTPNPIVVTSVINSLDSTLNKLINNVPSGQNTQTTSKQATNAVANAIAKVSIIDLSKSVVTSGGNATVSLDVNQFTDLFKTVKTNADNLNSKLAVFDPNAAPAPVTATLDLGTQTASNISVPLSTNLIQQAIDSDINSLSVAVNNVSLTVPVDQLHSDTTVGINQLSSQTATNVTNLKIASDVYNFEFTNSDNQNVIFTKPVTIKLPINDTSDVDTDLLTLAKIINGKLEYYGGTYISSGRYLEAERKSFSTYVIVEHKVDFSDTASVQSWAGSAIAIAAAKGIVQGIGNNNYAPNANVTRAEFAAMLVNAYQLQDLNATNSFTDVKSSDWFSNAVSSAVEAGIVNGETAKSFAPNATITRAEMATMAARALEVVKGYQVTTEDSNVLTKFHDAAAINSTLTNGVALAASLGIVIGDNDNFNPNASSTRAQAAVVMSRMLNQ